MKPLSDPGRQEDSAKPFPSWCNDPLSPQGRLIRHAAILSGLLTALSALLALSGTALGITLLARVYPGYRTIALSAALIWITLGVILAFAAAKPLRRTAALFARIVLAAIVAVEAIELPLSLIGTHSIVETGLTGIGESLFGTASMPISPMASALIILVAVALFLILGAPGLPEESRRIRNGAGIIGAVVALAGFTFVMSFVFGDPLLYGTQYIPIAALSALAALFAGAGVICAAGPDAIPLRYFSGRSTRARLLRTFIPLTTAIIIIQQAVVVLVQVSTPGHTAIMLSLTLVIFAAVTLFIVSRVSGSIGEALDRAEQDLVRKNEELGSMNEELAASTEELHQQVDQLAQSERKLRESEIRYRTVADFTLDWEFWFGPDGRIQYISPSAEGILGRPVSAYTGIRTLLQDVIHPDDRTARLAHLNEELAGSGPAELEYRIVRPDGEVRWIHHICRPIRDEIGNFLGTRGANRDITERKLAEKDLQDSRDDLELRVQERTAALKRAVAYNRNLLEASPDPLVTINPAGKISDVNAATVTATGFSREEMIGTDFSDYFTDPKRANEGYMTAFQEGFVTDYPLVIRNRNGGFSPVLYNATIFHDESGQVAGVFAAARDVSALKSAEKAIVTAHNETKLERQKLYDVLETLPVYVCLLDEDYRMPFANRYFRETFGHSLVRPCYAFLFNRDCPCETCETYTVMKTRAPHHWYWTGPNGRNYDIYDYPFTDTDGSLLILEMGIDITEQKRAEEALRRANEALERRVAERTAELAGMNQVLRATNEELGVAHYELNRNLSELQQREEELKQKAAELTDALAEKEMLLSEIHHRVKNNLTAFISLLSLEGSYEETAAGNQLKKDLQNRARSMALIHETLYRTKKYSHVDMGMYLTTLVSQIAASYTTRRDVDVTVNADGVILDLARATPCGLIINELVTNSFKYAFPGGFDCMAIRNEPCTIAVSLRSDDDIYLLTVRDNGSGLPPEMRLSTAKSLGLKLVNFLAKHQLRAEISVDSTEGTSIEFRFRKDPLIL